MRRQYSSAEHSLDFFLGFGLRVLWVWLWHVTNHAVNWSSSDRLRNRLPLDDLGHCGLLSEPSLHKSRRSARHLRRMPHPHDAGHVTATEYVKLLLFKADRGAKRSMVRARTKVLPRKRSGRSAAPRLARFRRLFNETQLHHMSRLSLAYPPLEARAAI